MMFLPARTRHIVILCYFALGSLTSVATADQVVKSPSSNTPEAVLVSAFQAAIAGDFTKYLECVHAEHKATERQRSEREKYEWVRFRKQFRWYLLSEQPVSFQIVSRREGDEGFIRIFLRDLKHPDRMPVPVRLKRANKGWKIVVSSL